LVLFDGVLEAVSGYVALAANGFGLLDLLQRWSGVAHWEEELRVLIEATGLV
jgi:hypothetical protein